MRRDDDHSLPNDQDRVAELKIDSVIPVLIIVAYISIYCDSDWRCARVLHTLATL